jgi:hypothetical protein
MEVVVSVLKMMRSLVVIMIAGSAFAQYPSSYKGAPYKIGRASCRERVCAYV